MPRECETKYCRNLAAKNRRICHKCKRKRSKESDPYGYHFDVLRQNAKRRGKDFSLTKEDYIALWTEHPDKWAEKLSEERSTWEVDRIDESKGYEPGNVQLMNKRMNVQKWHRYYRNKDQNALDFEPNWFDHKDDPDSEAPF